MSDEPTYILCMRQQDAKSIAEGSTPTNCCECDKAVWISPASVGVMLEKNAKPLCMWCAVEHPPPKGVQEPSPEQLKEIIKELKKQLKNEKPTDSFKKRTD